MSTASWTTTRWFAGSLLLLGALAACASTPEPTHITLSPDPLRVTVEQRKTKEVPELGVRFRMGDITAQRVLFEVGQKGGDPFITKRSIQPQGTAKLVIGEQTFLITLTEVHIVPGGTDFAVFSITDVTPAAEPEPEIAPTLEPDQTIAEEDEAGGPPELMDDEPPAEPAEDSADEPAEDSGDEPSEDP